MPKPIQEHDEIAAELKQLTRYLTRSMRNAGIRTSEDREDAVQSAIVNLCERLGTPAFEACLRSLAHLPIHQACPPESPESLAILRSIGRESKRRQRERRYLTGDDRINLIQSRYSLLPDSRNRRWPPIPWDLLPRAKANILHAILSGQSPQEVADRLGISLKSVHTAKQRAVAILRQEISRRT